MNWIYVVVIVVVVTIVLYVYKNRDMKGRTVALFNLTGTYSSEDLRALNVLKHSDIEYEVPYVDIGKRNIVDVLEEQYQLGKKIFIGPSTSTILKEAKIWFDKHPDTYSISLTSTAPSLSVQDNIIRLTPSDTEIVYVYTDLAAKIDGGCLILVQRGDLASEELGVLIDEECKKLDIKSELIIVDLEVDSKQVLSLLNSTNRLLMPFFLSQKSIFWSIYYESNSKSPLVESVGSNPPTLPDNIISKFNDNYMFLSAYPKETVILRRIRTKLGDEVSTNMYDSILISKRIDQLIDSKSRDLIFNDLSNIKVATGNLDLNSNGDRIYTDYLASVLINNIWTPRLLYGNDVNLGKFVAVLE